MNKVLKGLLGIGLAIAANASFAQSSNSEIIVSGVVEAGCMFTQPNFSADFGTIPGGRVGYTSTNIEVLCSSELPYSISFEPISPAPGILIEVSESFFAVEDPVLYKMGSGEITTILLGLRAKGNGPYCDQLDLGEGCVLTDTVSGLVGVIPMTLMY